MIKKDFGMEALAAERIAGLVGAKIALSRVLPSSPGEDYRWHIDGTGSENAEATIALLRLIDWKKCGMEDFIAAKKPLPFDGGHFFSSGTFGAAMVVLEFVPGPTLAEDGLDRGAAGGVTWSPDRLRELARLCALDVLINNGDRLDRDKFRVAGENLVAP